MKIAVLSDIHGNLPAFQSVLADVPSVDMFICCGDIVGYYPDAEEVCNLMRALNILTVRGNHDGYITGALSSAEEKTQHYKITWTRAHLSPRTLNWLASLPFEMKFLLDGLKIKMRHASPWDEETYLYPDSPRLAEIQLAQDEWLLVGHTHRPMVFAAGKGRIINPGAVGQPRDWNPLASYALIDTCTRQAVIRRVKYNVQAFQSRLKKLGWEPPLIDILSRAKEQNE